MPLPAAGDAAAEGDRATADVARILRAELAFALPALLPGRAAVVDAIAGDGTTGPHADAARRCVRDLLDSL